MVLSKIVFASTTVAMLAPTHYVKSESARSVAPSHTNCFYFKKWKEEGTGIVCYDSGGTQCIICQN